MTDFNLWFWVNIAYSIVAPLGVLLVPKMLLANRLYEGVNGYVSMKDRIINVIPWHNSYRIKKLIEGSAPLYMTLNIYALVTLAILIPGRTVFITGEAIQILVTMWVLLFLFVSYILEVILMVYLCRMFDRKVIAFVSVVPFLCAALLLPHIKPYFKKYQDQIKGTFETE